MAIKYREDPNLAFLSMCEEEDIFNLANILIYDSDGKVRHASSVLTDESFTKNINHQKKWQQSWKVVAGELQLYGGDSIVNAVRGYGVLYDEILSDVCGRIGVKLSKSETSVTKREEKLIEFLSQKAWENMSEEDRQTFLEAINKNEIIRQAGGAKFTDPSSIHFLLTAGGAAAVILYEYIANAVLATMGPALAARMVGSASLQFFGTRVGTAALAGPFAIALGVALAVPMVSGAAYRVTMPAVIQIAYMRKKHLERRVF